MKIYANDGKEFIGENPHQLVDECNTYESDIKLKKAQEEVERKAKEQKLEYIQKKFKDISKDIEEYQNTYKEDLRIYCDWSGELNISKYNRHTTNLNSLSQEIISELPKRMLESMAKRDNRI